MRGKKTRTISTTDKRKTCTRTDTEERLHGDTEDGQPQAKEGPQKKTNPADTLTSRLQASRTVRKRIC
jgi:hypothetical protein